MKMEARIALAGMPLLLMLAAAQFGWLPPADETPPAPQAQPSSARLGAGQRGLPPAATPVRIERAGVNSVFRLAPGGRLLLDAGAKDRLLVLLDQEERDHEPVAASEIATAGLAADQARQALAWLDAMRRLRAEEAALFTRPDRAEGVAAAARMHEELVALRRRHFGADAEAMFAADEERMRRQLDELRGPAAQGGG